MTDLKDVLMKRQAEVQSQKRLLINRTQIKRGQSMLSEMGNSDNSKSIIAGMIEDDEGPVRPESRRMLCIDDNSEYKTLNNKSPSTVRENVIVNSKNF